MVRIHSSRLLRDLGYDVIEASDGPTALEILASDHSIDLLFTDVVMPGGMTGVELAERAVQLRPELPVVYTSGYNEGSMISSGTIGSSATVLQKPYRREQLALTVRRALDIPT